jgi:lipoprotein NlpI
MWLKLSSSTFGQPGRSFQAPNSTPANGANWSARLVELYVGTASLEQAQHAVSAQTPYDRKLQRCETDFYGGEWQFIHGVRAAAQSALKDALIACTPGNAELEAARVALRKLP